MILKKVAKIFLLLSFINLLLAQAPKQPNVKFYSPVLSLQEQITELLNDINFANANIGIYIKSLDNGDILYTLNKDKLFQLASCTKIFTSVAAIEYLGSNYKYQTEVFYDGKLTNTGLKGNLYIVGSGDPTLKTFYTKDQTFFELFKDSLVYNDINEINGNIIGDDSYFDSKRYPSSWLFDYETKWFAPPTSALSFDRNSYEIFIYPTKIGEKIKYEIVPSNVYFSVLNNARTVKGNENNINVTRISNTNIVIISGTLGVEAKETSEIVTVNNPTQSFISNLKDRLVKMGIKVKGTAQIIGEDSSSPDYDNKEAIFQFQSSPLLDILKDMNKNSDNFIAEQVLKTIGAEVFLYGSTQNGLRAIDQLITKANIQPTFISLKDGSGLSPLSMATPYAMVDFLSFVYREKYFNEFLSTLPTMGVDGTLSQRLKRYNYKGKIIAKPGFSYGTSTLAGYIFTNDGEKLVFAIFINNYLGFPAIATKLQDEICFKLVNFSRKQ